ncbi:hypothetical protein [Chitinophaga filiformis]|uniref:Uncharacterized protein n=1 Tax=Chitinophaga filiformis TaxID=104663 RepID=A0A1G8AH40_CHIFI|nr:hypothetical protein [Chitinophaga filiformis]SDH19640.1 hypothetical protein SAMN04488121_109233 [Chitinophaga filiformis]
MKYLILLTTFSFMLSKCDAQQKDTGASEPVNILSPAFPFVVDVNRKNIILPDSLGGMESKGIAALAILIDSTGNFDGFNIKKLSINRFGTNIVDFVNVNGPSEVMKQTAYPAAVARYHHLLAKSIIPVKIKRNPSAKPEPLNEFILIVRFGRD